MIRFAVITDIHYGFDRGFRLGAKAPDAVDAFVKATNSYNPDFVIELGDRISAKSEADDIKYMTSLKNKFNKISCPVYSVIGNNDLRNLTRKQNSDIMGCSQENSYIKNIKGYRFLFWNPNVNTDGKKGLFLKKSDIKWLKNALISSKTPVIIFSHIPLDNTKQDTIESEAWDGAPNKSYYPEAEKIRELIEKSGNVILCLAGHKHTNRHRQYGETHFVVQQSLVQTETKERTVARNAFSFIEIKGDTIRIKGSGFKQPSHELKINKKNTPDFNV